MWAFGFKYPDVSPPIWVTSISRHANFRLEKLSNYVSKTDEFATTTKFGSNFESETSQENCWLFAPQGFRD